MTELSPPPGQPGPGQPDRSQPDRSQPDPSKPDPGEPGGRAARMRAALAQAFDPVALQIEDDSARHAGHAGAAPGGETHFTVRVITNAFAGMSRVQRSRAVHLVLAAEFAAGLHALSLDLRTPVEKTAV